MLLEVLKKTIKTDYKNRKQKTTYIIHRLEKVTGRDRDITKKMANTWK